MSSISAFTDMIEEDTLAGFLSNFVQCLLFVWYYLSFSSELGVEALLSILYTRAYLK